MKIKVSLAAVMIIFALGLILYLYADQATKSAEMMLRDYLGEQGFTEADIQSIDVRYSYLNHILSYNAWVMQAQFKAEPNVIYHFTIREGKIVPTGVSGNVLKESVVR